MIKKESVLIVDDDSNFMSLNRKILMNYGFEVFMSLDLVGLMDRVKKEPPSVILLDINLAEQNGATFLKERLKNKELQKIPVIVCSADNSGDTIRKMIVLGANNYIVKPIKSDELVKKIRATIKKSNELYFQFNPGMDEDSLIIEVSVELRTIENSMISFVSPVKFNTGDDLNLVNSFLKKLFNKENQNCIVMEKSQTNRVTKEHRTYASLIDLDDESIYSIENFLRDNGN